MAVDLIYKMASDLGIAKFEEETDLRYCCRTVYSGMACWIKAATLDLPVGSSDSNTVGVSRRHVFSRCNQILNAILKIKPELQEWFKGSLEEEEENAINLLRSRLLTHGDLLNAGFGTNVIIANKHVKQLTDRLETAFGELIQPGVYYSGIATVRHNPISILEDPKPLHSSVDWLKSYLKEAWWVSGEPPKEDAQYFDPFLKSKNNYSCWQDRMPNAVENTVLARTDLKQLPFEYYLFRPELRIVHKIDPFLIKRDEHIRIIMALRKIAGNSVPARATLFKDHIHFQINAILPLQELNLLETFAWPYKKVTDKFEWDMPLTVWEYIKPYLEALGINIMEVHHG